MHMRRNAFTIIELLVVITIIGLLTAVATTSYSTAQRSSRDSARKTLVSSIGTAVETYYRDKHNFPGALPGSGGNACEKIDSGDNSVSYSYVPKRTCANSPFVSTDVSGTWIPGLGAYMSTPPVDKRFLDQNGTTYDQIITGGSTATLGEVWTAFDGGSDATRTYTYRHLTNGYIIYTRLEAAASSDMATAITDPNTPTTLTLDPTKGNVYALRR